MVRIFPVNELQAAAGLSAHPALPAFAIEQCEKHRCDAHAVVVREGVVVARTSLWWNRTPAMSGERPGIVGHFAAVDQAAATEVLNATCGELKRSGCTTCVGPMDGNTWRRYRLLTERGTEPPFFLEPDNPDEWPGFFNAANFAPLATYFSAMNDDLTVEDPRIARATERLAASGVQLRSLKPETFVTELGRIYAVSRTAFQDNFLYSPIEEAEFLAQYEPIQTHVVPELVILAEQEEQPVGFVFSIPDLAQTKRGQRVDTVILKTVAVMPGRRSAGLGNVLVSRCQQAARALGFRRVIHALMHESNNSLNLSGRYAKPFRRYVLYARKL
jgi:GNAT superfamily N-acetyltransferase